MMLSDSELEALIRDSAPRELPASLRQSLARVLVPAPGHFSKLAWTGAAVILLLGTLALLYGAGRIHADTPPKPSPSATVPGVSNSPIPPSAKSEEAPENHVFVKSPSVSRDTIPPRLRFTDGSKEGPPPASPQRISLR